MVGKRRDYKRTALNPWNNELISSESDRTWGPGREVGRAVGCRNVQSNTQQWWKVSVEVSKASTRLLTYLSGEH